MPAVDVVLGTACVVVSAGFTERVADVTVVPVAALVALGVPVVLEYFDTGLVPRLPTAVLAVGAMLTGLLCLFAGLILDVVSESERSAKRRAYLSHPAPAALSTAARRLRAAKFR